MLKEIWKPVVGYENYYEVSNSGKMRSLNRKLVYIRDGKTIVSNRKGREMKPSISHGYVCTTISKGKGHTYTIRVHRLVCRAFHGPAPKGKSYVNHKNGIKDDNRACNLEWVSHKENVIHAYDNNLIKTDRGGDSNSQATLTKEQVIEIVNILDNSNLTIKEIAEKFNSTITIISYINTGRTWSTITGRCNKYNRRTKSVINCKGEIFGSTVDAGRTYKVDLSSIGKVCRGKQKTAGYYPDTNKRIEWRHYDN